MGRPAALFDILLRHAPDGRLPAPVILEVLPALLAQLSQRAELSARPDLLAEGPPRYGVASSSPCPRRARRRDGPPPAKDSSTPPSPRSFGGFSEVTSFLLPQIYREIRREALPPSSR